jgi:hypothetical protein
MEREIEIAPGVTLWTRTTGERGSPLLLVMGADASG